MTTRFILAVALALIFAASAGAQTTLYVNGTTGDDARTKTQAQNSSTPWRTIGRAAWGSTSRSAPNAAQAAAAGDTVMVSPGTYNYSGSPINNRFSAVYNPANEGTAANPITFRAQGTVQLTAPTTNSPVIGCFEKDYIIWAGSFELNEANVDIAPDTGMVIMVAATGCGLDGVIIDGDGIPDYDDNHNGVRIEGCNNCFVRNSTIFDVKHFNDGHNGSGIMLYNSNNTLIEHNYIYDVDNAVFIKAITSAPSTMNNTIVRRNLMVNCDECLTVQDSLNARIYQNVIRDGSRGLNWLARQDTPIDKPIGDWFVNNTVDNMSLGCIVLAGGPWYENVRVWNNIFGNCPDLIYRDNAFPTSESSIDYEHNNYFGFSSFGHDNSPDANHPSGSYSFEQWKATFGHDQAAPASITSNPMYAGAAADDFRLCTGFGAPTAPCTGVSPARSLGLDIMDLDGDGSTSDVVPAGAFITNNEVIGLPTSTTPSMPTGLRIVTP